MAYSKTSSIAQKSVFFGILTCLLLCGCGRKQEDTGSETKAIDTSKTSSIDHEIIEESYVRPVSVLFKDALKLRLISLAESASDEQFLKNYEKLGQERPNFDAPTDSFSYLLFALLDYPKRNLKLDSWAIEPATLYLKTFEHVQSFENSGEFKIIKTKFASSVLGFDVEGRDALIKKTIKETVEILHEALK